MALTKKQLAELKELLVTEKKRILDQLLKRQDASASELTELSGDSADIASLEISQASLHKLGSREQKLLEKIEHALAKFEDDTYGICELTGEDIPFARLKARPVAQYTVEAKEMLERKERGYRKNEEVDASEDYFPSDDDDE
ncbi:MAG: TraR/DksA family transcriptional regulator [Bdellovibrionales bacterium]|nr:TraR/DksA family transcriptional regulator [Bdellovibrionales bacterium]